MECIYQEKCTLSVVVYASIHVYRLSWSDVDYLTLFATRVRRLRETAGLTIQEVCVRGGISLNTLGKIERGEQEPCLLVIGSIAEGLGISTDVLMRLDDQPSGNNARTQIIDLLDLCCSEDVELSLRIVKAIHDHGASRVASVGLKPHNTQ
jgi:transcriptional regulator with XRE-family HTH domain